MCAPPTAKATQSLVAGQWERQSDVQTLSGVRRQQLTNSYCIFSIKELLCGFVWEARDGA